MNSGRISPGAGTVLLVIAVVILSLVFIPGSSLAGGYEADKEIPAEPGDIVSVYYSLSLPGGPVFESNVNGTPLNFTLGSGAVISGFDRAIRGMIPGETKTVVLTPDEAYGVRNESLVNTMPLSEAIALIGGMDKENITVSLIPGYPCPMIEYLPPGGRYQRYLFTNITEDSVTVDTNKPLAGKDLRFTITLDSVVRET